MGRSVGVQIASEAANQACRGAKRPVPVARSALPPAEMRMAGALCHVIPSKPCQGVVDGALPQIAPSFRAMLGIRIYTCQRLPRKAC